MSGAYVIGLIVAIAAAAVLAFVFFWEIVSIIVNVALLYLIGMRIYFKWQQREVTHYVLGLAAGAIIVLLLGNLFPFWRLTNVAVLGAIIAEVIYWYPRVMPRRKSRRKAR